MSTQTKQNIQALNTCIDLYQSPQTDSPFILEDLKQRRTELVLEDLKQQKEDLIESLKWAPKTSTLDTIKQIAKIDHEITKLGQ